MVGIVVVSHSSKISQGVVELSKQMAGENQKIISAGGTSDGGIGTDTTRIIEAIKEADSGDGVLILGDLGSAIMSSEMALDFLDEELKNRVAIADAPLVEGTIGAVVEASIGSNLHKVKETAESANSMNKI